MALNKVELGLSLYLKRSAFNNRTMDDLIAEFGSLEAITKAMCEADAEAIIDHIKQRAVVATTGTAAAQTGTIS